MNINQVLLGTALTIVSSGAFASFITVGGVKWNPDAGVDFKVQGELFESFAQQDGDVVTGFGKVNTLNNQVESFFCAACELTYSFSYTLASSAPTNGINFDFIFTNGTVNFYVDTAKNYGLLDTNGDPIASSFTLANATDGDLFLGTTSHGSITGTATDLFNPALISGTGTGFLDVAGGLAASNFNTNFLPNGADFKIVSSFGTAAGQFTPTGYPLVGGATLTGNSIPEPTSLALLGIGLLGFGASRIRKQA